jgi:hypothetical protein
VRREFAGCVSLALLLVASALADDRRIEVITLRSRPAEEVVEALRPFAGPDGELVVAQGRIVVNASSAALADIRRALEYLDPPPRSLWMTVSQQANASTTGRSAEFTVETKREDGALERRATRTLVGGEAPPERSLPSSTSTEPLRVLEGHQAFVRMTRAVPVPSTEPPSWAQGTVLAPGRTYLDGDVAVSIVARVTDDQVTLDVATTDDTVDNRGGLDIQRVHGTVSGPLGAWLSLGEAIGAPSPASGVLSTDQRLAEVRTLLVRIEDAP